MKRICLTVGIIITVGLLTLVVVGIITDLTEDSVLDIL